MWHLSLKNVLGSSLEPVRFRRCQDEFSRILSAVFFEFCAVISIIQYLLSREKLAVH